MYVFSMFVIFSLLGSGSINTTQTLFAPGICGVQNTISIRIESNIGSTITVTPEFGPPGVSPPLPSFDASPQSLVLFSVFGVESFTTWTFYVGGSMVGNGFYT